MREVLKMPDTNITEKSDENLSLISLAQSGDCRAMEKLVAQNMGLVKNIARRFIGRGTDYEDLCQIGTIGMIKAARSFDREYGTVFSTYAVPLIIGEIRRFLRDDGMIKVSRDIRRKGTMIMHEKELFAAEHQREPRLSELAEICNMTTEEVAYASSAVCPVYSLQENLGGSDDEPLTLENFVSSDESEIDKTTDRLALTEAIEALDETERRIIVLRFYKELSQQQTAKILGLTQVKISREEKKILEKLRKQL